MAPTLDQLLAAALRDSSQEQVAKILSSLIKEDKSAHNNSDSQGQTVTPKPTMIEDVGVEVKGRSYIRKPEEIIRMPTLRSLNQAQFLCGQSSYVNWCRMFIKVNKHRKIPVTEPDAKDVWRRAVEEITDGGWQSEVQYKLMGQMDCLSAHRYWQSVASKDIIRKTTESGFFLTEESRTSEIRREGLMLWHHTKGVKIAFPNLMLIPYGLVDLDELFGAMMNHKKLSNVTQSQLYFVDIMKAAAFLIYHFIGGEEKQALLEKVQKWEQADEHEYFEEEAVGLYGQIKRKLVGFKVSPKEKAERQRQLDYKKIAQCTAPKKAKIKRSSPASPPRVDQERTKSVA